MARVLGAVQLESDDLEGLDASDRLSRRSQAIWAHRPRSGAAVKTLAKSLAEEGTLPPRLVELVRLRIAFHNQCRYCMALRYTDALDDGLTEDMVCSLERPAEANDLTDAERSALRFADLFATNHLAIDDPLLDELRIHFDEGQIVELGAQCARLVGFGRLAAVFGVYDDLPERFAGPGTERFTPWGGDVVIRKGAP